MNQLADLKAEDPAGWYDSDLWEDIKFCADVIDGWHPGMVPTKARRGTTHAGKTFRRTAPRHGADEEFLQPYLQGDNISR
jgi:hypothetical protein